MYTNLTKDFFLSHKGRFFWTTVSVALLIGIYLLMNAPIGATAKIAAAVPDLLYTGNVTDEFKWAHLEDLSPETLLEIEERAKAQAAIVPATQRFMLSVQNALGYFRFHLVGVPQAFIDAQLPALIATGRAPQAGEAGIIAGRTVAGVYNLSVGDVFTTTLAPDVFEATVQYRVLGLFDENVHDFYDRALFVATETYQAHTGNAVTPNTFLVFLNANSAVEEFVELVRATEAGASLPAPAALKDVDYQHTVQLISSILMIGLCSFNFYDALKIILNRSAKRIGLLKAMGMRDGEITGVFITGISIIFGLATLLGLILALIGFHYLNRAIGDIIDAEVQIYRLSAPLLAPLLGMLAGALGLVILSVRHKSRRIPPRKAMLEI